jgi:hypothetical protein
MQLGDEIERENYCAPMVCLGQDAGRALLFLNQQRRIMACLLWSGGVHSRFPFTPGYLS